MPECTSLMTEVQCATARFVSRCTWLLIALVVGWAVTVLWRGVVIYRQVAAEQREAAAADRGDDVDVDAAAGR